MKDGFIGAHRTKIMYLAVFDSDFAIDKRNLRCRTTHSLSQQLFLNAVHDSIGVFSKMAPQVAVCLRVIQIHSPHVALDKANGW